MKPRVKVYELAEELGRKSRELLDAAGALGIPAQNRLTKLDSESVRRLQAYFRGRGASDGSGPDSPAS